MGARTTHAWPSKPTCRESRRPTSAGSATGSTGENCTNPPPGAQFYPIYTTGKHGHDCFWQFGGKYLPGTQNTFGGNSTAEYGPLLQSVYPGAGFVPLFRYNNFRQILNNNPCPT